MRIRYVNMDFLYGTSFLRQSPEAYERLLLDCMLGDATLFARVDEVEEAWRFLYRDSRRLASAPARSDQLPQLRGRDVGA